MAAEGFLTFDSKAKTYAIGPTVFALAVQANPWFSHRELYRPALDNVARRTSDTVMLSVRVGAEAVCVARHEGSFPIRVLSLNTGSSRPLGAGSGSLAILAFLPRLEQANIVGQSAARYQPFGLTATEVMKAAAEAHEAGFAFNPGRIIEGVHGVGVPILENGVAVAAVSVAAVASRLTPPRLYEVVSIMREEISAISGVGLPAFPADACVRKAV